MRDLDLAKRVVAGQESAAEELFAEYFSRLYRFAWVRVDGNPDAAEEVVQATLILAMRKLHTYRGEAALFTWLCTLCRREIGAWRRANRIEARAVVIDDHPDVRRAADALAGVAASDPEDEASRMEVAKLVQLTLDQLPANYSAALEWRYIQGLGVGEIAERLGVGYKAAESILSRARLAFKDGFPSIAGAWPADRQ